MIKKTIKNIFTLILAAIFALTFLGIILVLVYYAIKNPSFTSVIGCLFGSIIPGFLIYGVIGAAIDYVKENFFNK